MQIQGASPVGGQKSGEDVLFFLWVSRNLEVME